MGKQFCTHCGKDQEYIVDSRPDTIEIRGTIVCYSELYAVCRECGEELYVPEISDANIASIEVAYRQAAHLISIEEIRDIMEKYDITANPLSKVLGFGEITISRYLSGSIPSRAHSDMLIAIGQSVSNMQRKLEENRTAISDVAYRKCRAAVDRLLSLENCSKIETVAQYLIKYLGDVTPMALQKLLYYVQAFFAVLNDQVCIFDDVCEAWTYGPVYPEVYRRYREYGCASIELSDMRYLQPDLRLSPRELEIITAVANSFGGLSGGKLSDITHHETPWLKARGNLPDNARSCNPIDRVEIRAYFDQVVKEYDIKSPNDISRYCQAMARQGMC